MPNILSVSVEPALLYTRGLVLERTGAFVESATPAVAVSLMRRCIFDVVVLCHSLGQRDAEEVCCIARACRPQTKILALESPVVVPLGGVQIDCRVSLEDGPALLVSMAHRLLSRAEKPLFIDPALHEFSSRRALGDNVTSMTSRLMANLDPGAQAPRPNGKHHDSN